MGVREMERFVEQWQMDARDLRRRMIRSPTPRERDLWDEAHRSGARIFFADEAHFRADAELRGKWVLKGEPALVDSSSPRYGEKASYYSAVCLETGEVEWMELDGNGNSETPPMFLRQLRERHLGR